VFYKHYYVYVLASKTHRLYVGVTGNLERRIGEHKSKIHSDSFTSRYNINQLVHYEIFGSIHEAIAREKELKGWLKYKKYALIEAANPQWHDLSEEWNSSN
jgi:putative endonuclease